MISNASSIAGTRNSQFQAAVEQQQGPRGAGKRESATSFSYVRHDTLTQQVSLFSCEVSAQFPHLSGHNRHHVFIAGADGVTRRFPSNFSPDRPAVTSVPRRWADRLEMQGVTGSMLDPAESQRILDFSGQDRGAKVVAGYEFDPEGQVAAYAVDAQRTVSLLGHRSVFTLETGPSGESQYMVCQTEMLRRAGAFACRDMLLAEGKSVAEVIALLGKDGPTAMAKWMPLEQLVEMLTHDWTDRPLVLSLEKKTHEQGLLELKEKLDKHGSCMLGFDEERWAMLDSLEQLSPGHWTHRTRSPFHGSVVESHTKLGASDGQPGSRTTEPNFGSSDMNRVPLYLDLTDASIAVFRSPPLAAKGRVKGAAHGAAGIRV